MGTKEAGVVVWCIPRPATWVCLCGTAMVVPKACVLSGPLLFLPPPFVCPESFHSSIKRLHLRQPPIPPSLNLLVQQRSRTPLSATGGLAGERMACAGLVGPCGAVLSYICLWTQSL